MKIFVGMGWVINRKITSIYKVLEELCTYECIYKSWIEENMSIVVYMEFNNKIHPMQFSRVTQGRSLMLEYE